MAWDLVGHREAVAQLDRALKTGRLAHAYLFVGSKGVGKGALARALAQAVNCAGPERPCGVCPSCRRIGAGKHADVHVLDVEVKDGKARTEISIEQVAELQRLANLRPFEGTWRVFIVESAEHLSAEAANRLLKTLEEPPPQVLLLLLTASERELLPTLRSRCQRIELRALAEGEVVSALRARGLTEETARRIARLSRGRTGWALRAAADEALLRRREERLDQVAGLLAAGREQRFAFAAELATLFSRNREEARTVLEMWQEWWRDLLLWRAGLGEWTTNRERQPEGEAQASQMELREIAAGLRRLEEAAAALEANATPRLALDVLMLALPHVAATRPAANSEALAQAQSHARRET